MEEPVSFHLQKKRLYGILHLAENKRNTVAIVLMVIGGPQTRVGSHRLYVQLARGICEAGVSVFRFDYEGIGDSEGGFVGFESAGLSIRAALDFLFDTCPSLKDVIIWSLCDGSTACAIYAKNDRERISGMILCNPFVETEENKAKTVLKYYYVRRLLQKEFWKKIFLFKLDVMASINSLVLLVQQASSNNGSYNDASRANDCIDLNIPLPEQMVESIVTYNKPIRFLLSTDDLTAMEFRDIMRKRSELAELMSTGRVSIKYIKGADHTFSKQSYKEMVLKETLVLICEFGLLHKPNFSLKSQD